MMNESDTNDATAEGQAADATGTSSTEPVNTTNGPIDIPDHIAAQLPEGTVVHADAGDTVVATVTKDGIEHRIAAAFGNEWHHLVAAVEKFFGRSSDG